MVCNSQIKYNREYWSNKELLTLLTFQLDYKLIKRILLGLLVWSLIIQYCRAPAMDRAVCYFIVLTPSISGLSFLVFSVSCVAFIPLFCFHCRGPRHQAPLSPKPHCSSFACSIPFHSHSAWHLSGFAHPCTVCRIVVCAKRRKKIPKCSVISAYTI